MLTEAGPVHDREDFYPVKRPRWLIVRGMCAVMSLCAVVPGCSLVRGLAPVAAAAGTAAALGLAPLGPARRRTPFPAAPARADREIPGISPGLLVVSNYCVSLPPLSGG